MKAAVPKMWDIINPTFCFFPLIFSLTFSVYTLLIIIQLMPSPLLQFQYGIAPLDCLKSLCASHF